MSRGRSPTGGGPRLAAVALLTAALAAAGCASGPRLADERTTAPYPSLLARNAAARHEVESHVVVVPGSPAVEVALEHVTAGHGAARPLLVLQPGVVADRSTWRFLVGALVADHDVLLVDPPGCGDSGMPDPRCAPDAYSPAWLAEHTVAAVEAWSAAHGPRDLVLVGHSLGATAMLRALADPGIRARHEATIRRVRGAVLLAPADIAMDRASASAIEIATVTDLEAGLGCALGVVRRKVDDGIRENAVHPERDALRQDAERIACILCRPASRRAAQAMLVRFRPQDAEGRPIEGAIAPLLAEERSVPQPILVVWGDGDETLPIAQAPRLLARLPTAHLEVIRGAKHSIQQERAEETADHVRRFVASLERPASR